MLAGQLVTQKIRGDGAGQYWQGEVLFRGDARAWGKWETPKTIAESLARLDGQEVARPYVPVLWDFGRIYWEEASTLVPWDGRQHKRRATGERGRALETNLRELELLGGRV